MIQVNNPTIDSNNVELHKIAAQKVLDNVPVRPNGAYSLKNPLGYLTSKCSSTHSDKFTQREILSSKRIFGWQNNLDLKIRRTLNQIIEQRDFDLSEWYKDRDHNPPLVIRASSGAGKSILLAKIFSELIEHILAPDRILDNEKIEGAEEWPKFDQVVFSQLRNNQNKSIYSREKIDNFEGFNKSYPSGNRKNILIIDSLDEHNDAKSWYDFSKKIGKNWFVIWSCRDPDWDNHELSCSVAKEDKEWYEEI